MKHVYMVRAGHNHYKIGVAHNITKRIKAMQTSNAEKIELVTARLVYDHAVVEKLIHKTLRSMRQNGGREWFKLDHAQALEICVLINQNPEIDVAEQVISRIKKQIYTIVDKYDKSLEAVTNKPEASLKLVAPRILLKPNNDELDMQQALDIFSEEGKASTSLLQRRMSIGYGRASRIMDKLYQQGKISELDGSRPREVLV